MITYKLRRWAHLRTRGLVIGTALVAAALATAAHAAPPANDPFAAAQMLTGGSGSVAGTTAEATRQVGESDHTEDATGRTVWYRWTAPVTAPVAFETCGAARFDTIVAAYVGADIRALTRVASNDDSCGEQSRISFDVTAGTTYSIVVDGYDGAAGAFTLSWREVTRPPNDSFASAQRLAGASGTTTGRTVGASHETEEPGPPGAATIWYRWTAPHTGGALFETCGSTTLDTFLASYTGTSPGSLSRLAANDDSCEVGSRIHFRVRVGTTYILRIHVVDGGAGMVRLSWIARAIPPNAEPARPQRLRGVRGSVSASNVGSPSTSMWYRWRAPQTMPISFATCSRATFDTVVSVYEGASPRRSRPLERDDDGCGDHSRAVFSATAGIEYRIGVSGFEGEVGNFTLTWRRARPFERPCRVPDVRGQTLARARVALAGAVCRVGRVAFAGSSIVPRGRVIAQYPNPGARLPILGRVNLEVSRGWTR